MPAASGDGIGERQPDDAPWAARYFVLPRPAGFLDGEYTVVQTQADNGRRFAAHTRNALVSIVIPCYKGARYLGDAIESCLQQTYRDIEVIVVDDASPDGCHAIALKYADQDSRVRAIRRAHNGGVAEAFNTGFTNARGSFHTRLAQDDVFEPHAVERMVGRLRDRPDCGLAYADVIAIDESGETRGRGSNLDPEEALCWGNGVGVCVMWRRRVWERVGTFDPSFDAAEDFDYWVRVAALFPITKVLGAPLLRFRCHGAMGSVVRFRKQEDASLRIRRRMFSQARFPSRHFWQGLRSLSHHYSSFSHDHSVAGDHWGALSRIALSFLCWPAPFPRARVRNSCARLRLLVTIVLRPFGFFGGRQGASRIAPCEPSNHG